MFWKIIKKGGCLFNPTNGFTSASFFVIWHGAVVITLGIVL